MINVNEIIKMYVEEKMSAEKIGINVGLSQGRILKLLKDNGIDTKRIPKITKDDIPEIIRLYKEEYWSGRMIGEKYNVCTQWIIKILNNNGVDTSTEVNGSVITRCIICNKKIKRTRKRFRTNHNNFCCHEHYLQWIQENKTENYNEHRQGQRNARKVVEKYYGELPSESVVHHIDGNCDNNVIENLILFPSQSEHMKFHRGNKEKCIVLFDGRNCHEYPEE